MYRYAMMRGARAQGAGDRSLIRIPGETRTQSKRSLVGTRTAYVCRASYHL